MRTRSSRFFVILLHLVGVSQNPSWIGETGIVAVLPWPMALERVDLYAELHGGSGETYMQQEEEDNRRSRRRNLDTGDKQNWTGRISSSEKATTKRQRVASVHETQKPTHHPNDRKSLVLSFENQPPVWLQDSADGSCLGPTGTFSEFPIRFIVEFYQNHGLLSVVHRPTWRVIQGGSRTYVQAMTRTFHDRIRLQSPVQSLRRFASCVEVQLQGGQTERFDHLILACHSDQALQILGEQATPIEREVLGSFPYSQNVAVLHTDSAVLPQARRAWAR